jgi:hypothetical protein
MTQDEARVRAAGCDGDITKPADYKSFTAEVGRRLMQEAGAR